MPAEISRNVERLRQARGLSRAELSRRVGLSEAELASALRAEEEPRAPLISALATQLIVPDFVLTVRGEIHAAAPLVDFRSAEPAPSRLLKKYPASL
jgi:transcriptional regulator with XRE-family HTH domain